MSTRFHWSAAVGSILILAACGAEGTGSSQAPTLPGSALTPSTSTASRNIPPTTLSSEVRLEDSKPSVDLSSVTLPPPGSVTVVDATSYGYEWSDDAIEDLRKLIPRGEPVRVRMAGMEAWPEECLLDLFLSAPVQEPERAPDFSAEADPTAIRDAVDADAIVERRSQLKAALCADLEAERRDDRGDADFDQPASPEERATPSTVPEGPGPVFAEDPATLGE